MISEKAQTYVGKNEIPIGYIKTPYYGSAQLCTVEVTLKNTEKGLELSISASLWNKRFTDITEGGQMQDTIEEALKNITKNPDRCYFKKLFKPYAEVRKLVRIWNQWHLNGMNGGCVHQREAKWEDRKHDNKLDVHEYLRRFGVIYFNDGYKDFKHWSDTKTYGLLCEPCPKCGYKYGTAWLFEEIPQPIIEFVKAFAGSQLQTQ